ncbi:MAG: serine hydroxymethyltransferase [Methanocellales archaeon]|nr:serine hydroxymethyltransferase [Methanocellales archaeon]
MNSDVRYIMDATKAHHELFKNSLPMIASENVTSPTVRRLIASDLGHRYAEGKVGHRYYQGCKYIDQIEAKAIELAKRLFDAEHVNVQPVSGVNANLAAFTALAEPRDLLISLDVPDGGHISHAKFSAAGIRGLRITTHPFDEKKMNVDADLMIKKILEVKPKVIVFGASLFLFPHPVKEARSVADEVGAKIVYDAAHVLGLIAGKRFQDPLREGADIATGPTHKSFPGPQGALILCKSDVADAVDNAVFPGTTSNHHLHHKAGLAVALAEMLTFGEDYAKQMVTNAQVLAQSLYDSGLDVLCKDSGFTQSHQIAFDVSKRGGGAKVASNLEKANIITNKNLLPWDDVNNPGDPSGIRLGTQELTRLGMKESEMKGIADLIKRIVIDEEKPERVKNDVISLRKDYQKVHYCFDGEGAYDLPFRW